jgi:1,4-alpha-glucan branching enzyme
MDRMLQFWTTRYNIDGFRFDSADNPDGPGRMIPARYWQEADFGLSKVQPVINLLGECETPDRR